MDKKAMYKLSYGLFVLTARESEKDNGCIINTAIQAASEPNQLSICVNKSNYTHDMIERTGKFTVSVLNQNAQFELFKHFGFQSGRDTNKFETFEKCARGTNGIYYITQGTNAYISVTVNKTEDLGSHTMFIGEITDMEVLSDIPSLTYEYYQNNIKPKPQAVGQTEDGQTIWRCRICGYEYVGEELPDDFICPLCKHPASDFEKVVKKTEVKEMAANKYAGTQTEKNLQEAFAGESQARNKYTYFASVAKKEGYEAILFFVIQMKEVRYFTPNQKTQPEFAEALKRAKAAGVKILAYDCEVSKDKIRICDPVDVVLESPQMKETVPLIVEWYRKNRRDLPWRKNINAYRVWISEIMLQQTRVEAVKPYYERFLSELPDIEALANVEEDKLLKLWEGLGYYNRARNLKLAAQQIMEQYGGKFPETYEKIRELKGIGNYTAGAIGSFVYDLQKPAVDGNVFRVVSRILEDADDILKASTRKKVESLLEEVIPKESPGDFNQGLIELGAIVCLPGGEPKCEICPVSHLCLAHRDGCELEYPVKKKAKERRVEKKTILRFCDNEEVAIRKRPDTGLLAGLYEFPNVEGHLKQKEVIEYAKSLGLTPVRVKKLPDAKHIFSHVEWQMKGYEVIVDELERELDQKIWSEQVIFAEKEELEKKYPMPSAFAAYQL